MRIARRLLLVTIACAAMLLAAAMLMANRKPQPLIATADRVVVLKSSHSMSLYREGRLLATYHAALGRGGSGQKLRAGDNRVPEGVYPVIARNAHSAFYRSLRLGYPTAEQRVAAQRQGIDPGGDIMIHGIRNGLGWLGSLQSKIDWTKGCVAVTDSEMDQIWASVPVGTIVEIRP